MNPIHQAAITDCAALEALLVGNPYQVRQLANARDETGRTPLHWAASHNRVDCMKVLTQAGADRNARDRNKCTPLHDAVRAGAIQAIEALMRGGARTVLQDTDGYTALDLADERDPELRDRMMGWYNS